MAIDLAQFHQVFFEESVEGLDIMESTLMELDITDIDDEMINTIFRSAHSIKGGSATFGFNAVAEFTHVLETLLDQVRSGQRGLRLDDVNLFLQSVDCMREMLELLQQGGDGITALSKELAPKFTAILQEDLSVENQKTEALPIATPEVLADEPVIAANTWEIVFTPYEHIFMSGNDPLRNIQSLASLGELTLECHHSKLPLLSELNPENVYLSWAMLLTTDKSIADIEEVFEWIEDDCDVTINLQHDKSLPDESNTDWSIHFVPGIDILRTGNEPLRLIRALSELGKINVVTSIEKLPDVLSMDSENCYLYWDIVLSESDASLEDIHEVFEWVVDDSELIVKKIAASSDNMLSSASTNEVAISNTDIEVLPAKNESQSTPLQKTAQPVVNKTAVKKKAVTETSSIRVGIDKVDSLINMVGELVITQSMLGQLGAEHELDRVPNLMEGLSQLEQNTRELQESVMKIRMLPISFVFSRFPRMVRDLGQTLGKSVSIEMNGENTELDKTVMEKIGDPLVHLVRNAVDHGLETPEERTSQGKDPTGSVTLNAYHQSGNVVIEIVDDGKGLDRERILSKAIENGVILEKDVDFMSDDQIYELIFQPGFSTAQTVSDVSGRGVGMDVVKRNIQALNGAVEITSEKGKGSKITIRLPLTLAILDGQLVRVGGNTYIFSLVSIIESMQCKGDLINRVGAGCDVFKLRDEYVPIIELFKTFSIDPDTKNIDDSLLVVVESDGEKVGIVVDELLGQQQVVIKSLENNYRRVEGVSGATILGDGTVALILDIPGIIKMSAERMGVSTQKLGSIIASHSSTPNSINSNLRAVG